MDQLDDIPSPTLPDTKWMTFPSILESIPEVVPTIVPIVKRKINRTCIYAECKKRGIYRDSMYNYACFRHKTAAMILIAGFKCSIDGCNTCYSRKVFGDNGTFTKYCKSHAPKGSCVKNPGSNQKCTVDMCDRTASFWSRSRVGYRCSVHAFEGETRCAKRNICVMCQKPGYYHNLFHVNNFRCADHKFAGDVVCEKQYDKIQKFIGGKFTAKPKKVLASASNVHIEN